MNRIHAIKCCTREAHAIVVCHMTTQTPQRTIHHIRACHAKHGGHLPDTTPCGPRHRQDPQA